jgi:hypothetical protein
MPWKITPLEILNINAEGEAVNSGRWRMTAEPDIHEAAIAPYGDLSHDHGSIEEASACEKCDEFIASLTGKLSRRKIAELEEERDRKEWERLKGKYGRDANVSTENP